MTESRLKRIVEEIKKIAEGELDNVVVNKPAPTNPTPTGTAPTTTTNTDPGGLGDAWTTNKPAPQGRGGGQVNVVGDIKNMQDAMQQFAEVATKYGSAKQQSLPPGQKAPPAKLDSRKKQFNDFITEQYVANSDLKGEEFTPDEKRTAKDQKQPTDLIEMNVVVNGLQRIGGPASELKADNYWDFRTNNALKNVYAFAYGLVNLAKDFGRTDAQSFTTEDLAKMKENIPEDRDPKDLKPAEKVTRAKALTPLIKKLTKFYKYYIDNIAMHPGFTSYIAGDEKMMTLQRGGGDPTALNAQEKQLLPSIDTLQLGAEAIPNITNKYPINFPSPKGQGGVIGLGSMPISALQNINVFRQFMTNMGFPQNQTSDPRYQRAALDAVMKHIDSVLALPEAQEKTTPPQQQTPAVGSGDLTGQPGQGVRNVPA